MAMSPTPWQMWARLVTRRGRGMGKPGVPMLGVVESMMSARRPAARAKAADPVPM